MYCTLGRHEVHINSSVMDELAHAPAIEPKLQHRFPLIVFDAIGIWKDNVQKIAELAKFWVILWGAGHR